MFTASSGSLRSWLIFDVSDGAFQSFFDLHFTLGRVLGFYAATQIPQILVILLPVSAPCAALLFVLGRMSRANEIVSMLTAEHLVSSPRPHAALYPR